MTRPRFGSAPVFLQVLALVMASVVAAQAVNFWIVLSLPEPPPSGFSADQAARALKGEVVRTADGRTIRARVVADPPFAQTPARPPSPPAPPAPPAPPRPGIVPHAGHPARLHLQRHEGHMERVIALALARRLEQPLEDVRVQIRAPEGPRRFAVRALETRRTPEGSAIVENRTDVLIFERNVAGPPPEGLRRSLEQLPPAVAARLALLDDAIFPPFAAAVRRADGRWTVVEPSAPLFAPWQTRLFLGFLLTALLVSPFAWWIARRLTRPIRAFSEAAERLGANPNAPALSAQGPAEVRTAVVAFNDMQEKLRRYVEQRTSMVAAIAHDLRTPLTRLRFRAEAAPEPARSRMIEDVEQMDAMIAQALAYARGGRADAPRARLDLSALAQAVALDQAELGRDVRFLPGEPVEVSGDAGGLKRLVANLVENAVAYAGAARVSVRAEDGAAVLTVADDGPGVPDALREALFEPFARGEPSRSRETGGVGLGLAVARAIAEAHGGTVALVNRPEGGLDAVARLPLGTGDAARAPAEP